MRKLKKILYRRKYHIILLVFAFFSMMACPFAYSFGGGYVDHSFINCSETQTKKKHHLEEQNALAGVIANCIAREINVHLEPLQELTHSVSLHIPVQLSSLCKVRLLL